MKRSKKMKWKRILPYVLMEAVAVAAVLFASWALCSDTYRTVRAEISGKMEYSSRTFYEYHKKGLDEAMQFYFDTKAWLPDRLEDPDYRDCVALSFLCHYDNSAGAGADSARQDEWFCLNQTTAYLKIDTYEKAGWMYDGTRSPKERHIWDLRLYFPEEQLLSFVREMGRENRYGPIVQKVKGRTDGDGRLILTEIEAQYMDFTTDINGVKVPVSLRSEAYRETDRVLSERTGDDSLPDCEVYCFLQNEELLKLLTGYMGTPFVEANGARYLFRRFEYGYYELYVPEELLLRKEPGSGDVSFKPGEDSPAASVGFYVLFDVGRIVWRKANRKILMVILFGQVGAFLLMVLWNILSRRSRELRELRETFINAMAHELKTPVAVVRSTAEYLQTGARPEKREHYLNTLVWESDSMNSLLERMLTYSRMTEGGASLKKEATDWNEIIERLVDAQEALLAEKGLQIAFAGKSDQKPVAEPGLLQMVLDNLISNAVRYAEPGSQIVLQTSGLRFTVWNKAEPLSEEDIKNIWTPMYQTEREKKEARGGGMGLAICAAVLDRHEATYGVKNVGEGVQFYIDFSKAQGILGRIRSRLSYVFPLLAVYTFFMATQKISTYVRYGGYLDVIEDFPNSLKDIIWWLGGTVLCILGYIVVMILKRSRRTKSTQ